MKKYKGIFWDVYGTLMASRAGDLQALVQRGDELLEGFEHVINGLELGNALRRYDPDHSPPKTLRDLYLREIEASQRQRRGEGVRNPEVRIEEVWMEILKRLGEHHRAHDSLESARRAALRFEQVANPKKLYPTVCETLQALKAKGLTQGIVSNAQFYTRIELEELLRQASGEAKLGMDDVFEPELVILSCDLGVSKPGLAGFEKLRELIEARRLHASQCLYVGNDMLNDVWCAKQCGFDAALFAGDPESVRWRKDDPRCADLKPDAVIQSHKEILGVV